jgi:hypothetical protein
MEMCWQPTSDRVRLNGGGRNAILTTGTWGSSFAASAS